MGSIRSMFSLQSLRGNSPIGEAPPEDRQRLSPAAANGSSTVKSRSQGGGFFKLPDPNGSSKDNQHVAMELSERKLMEKGMPSKAIVVQEDLDQKVVHATHEMV